MLLAMAPTMGQAMRLQRLMQLRLQLQVQLRVQLQVQLRVQLQVRVRLKLHHLVGTGGCMSSCSSCCFGGPGT
jgi:hypothetical protein